MALERSDTGDPEKYCAANFLGRGETNVANLKGLLANLFLLRNLFGRAGVPPTTLHSSLFTIHCVKVSFTLTVPLLDIVVCSANSCRHADSCSAMLHSCKLLFAVDFPLTAGFACNCQGFLATVSEANNCAWNAQLNKKTASPKRNSRNEGFERLSLRHLHFYLKIFGGKCNETLLHRQKHRHQLRPCW